MKVMIISVVALGLFFFTGCTLPGSRPLLVAKSDIIVALWFNKIERIEIICLPTRVETLTAVTPEMLDTQYEFKLIVMDATFSGIGRELLEAAKAERFTPSAADADYRWGCLFYDGKSDRVAVIYLAGWGRGAMVNGSTMASSGKLIKRLHQICSGFR